MNPMMLPTSSSLLSLGLQGLIVREKRVEAYSLEGQEWFPGAEPEYEVLLHLFQLIRAR